MAPHPTRAKEIGLACVCGHGVGVYGEAEHLGEGADHLDLWAIAHEGGAGRRVICRVLFVKLGPKGGRGK